MPYGVKRGMKAPGEYGLSDILGLGLAGATGIVAALVTDFQQKGEASALFTLNHWAADVGELVGMGHIPLWTVVLGLIAIGAGSIFYFQPITRQGAFAQGFGLLAVLVTAIPADLASGLNGVVNEELPGLSEPSVSEALFQPQSAPVLSARVGSQINGADVSGQATVTKVRRTRAATYNVNLTIELPNGTKDEIRTMLRKGTLRGRLHNEDSETTYNLFRNAGSNISISPRKIVIRASVPARSETATLWTRIEVDGYAIDEQSARAKVGEALNWRITMSPSSTPLFLQRLQKSYWF